MSLQKALDQVRAGNDTLALHALVQAWRGERDPRLADVIEHLSRRLTRSQPVLGDLTSDAGRKAWIAIETANEPADLGRLLAVAWPKRWQDALPFLRRLSGRPDDPRIAMALARLVEAMPFVVGASKEFYLPALKVIERTRDARTLPILERQRERPKPRVYEERVGILERRTVEHLRGVFAEGTPSVKDTNGLEELEASFRDEEKALERDAATDENFMRAIYESPEDDEARAVYADVLLARGDLRGEFIALSLARGTSRFTDAVQRRMHALLREHGRAWAGGAGAALELYGRRFERGFLVSGRVRPVGAVELERAFEDASWGLVRALAPGAALANVLTAPALHRVRALHEIEEQELAWLA